MSISTATKPFMLILISALIGCASPLKQGRDLGDPASIADAAAPVVVSRGDGINLTAFALKQSVELGEPVYLALRVSNERRDTLSVIGGLRPGGGLVEVFLIDAKGEKTYLPPLSASDYSGSISLSPGQTIGDVFPVFFGADGWNFRQAGEYRILVQLKVPNNDGYWVFDSKPISIQVKSSSVGQGLFSADGRIGVEAGKFLYWRSGDHLKSGIEYLNSVISQNPDSTLASYISAAHVQNFSEPFANYIVGDVRAADCRQANTFRKLINTGALPDNLLIEDYISQAKCHAENRRWKEAGQALDAGSRLCADRPEFAAYFQSIAAMQKRLDEYL